MGGRIVRPDTDASMLELPEIGRLHIGKKEISPKTGKEYPVSVDYFIPSGKYAGLFTQALGEKPQTIQIIFPDDNPEKVCNERWIYRDDKGALVAKGDGHTFEIWNGKQYVSCNTDDYPDFMEQVAKKNPLRNDKGIDNWSIELTLKFIIPAVRGVVGVWGFTTKGRASSIKNIRNSFDGVQMMFGSVMQTVFDLSVQFAKSNKPNDTSRYPVVSLISNANRIDEVRKNMLPKENLSILLLDNK